MQTLLPSKLAHGVRLSLLLSASFMFLIGAGVADDKPKAEPAKEAETEKETEAEKEAKLDVLQKRIASKYELLEQMLLRNAEFEAIDNPSRAALLKKAYNLSHNDRGTNQRLKEIVMLLNRGRFADAKKDQEVVVDDLNALLKLLLSQNHNDRIRQQRDRYKEYIRELERIIRIQRGLQGQTEGGADLDQVAKGQGGAADKARDLEQKIGENEGSGNGDSEGDSKGDSEGDSKGDSEGDSKGDSEGDSKGDSEGDSKGDSEGDSKGDSEGDSKGDSEGDSKGDSEGDSKGDSEGDSKGDSEGDSKGDSEGDSKGDSEGDSKGDSEGDSKGDSEGDSKGDSEGDSKGDSEGDSKGDSEGDSKGDSEGDSKGDSEGDSKGDSEGDSKGDSEGDSKGDSEGDSKGDSEGDSKGDSEGDSKGDSNGDSKGDSEGDSKGDSESNPARERIKQAEQKMREAKQKLEDAKRNEAVEDQEEARKLLEEAKAELEEILRQLREEEIERMLALLEGRFVKMLEMQTRVYENTLRLNRIPPNERGPEVDIKSGKLAFEQRKIVIEAEKAYNLLVEEGSSIAFPETVDQMREDMQQISERLAATKIALVTQGLEEDVIATLEELIAALQKAQEEPPESPPPPPGDPPPPGEPVDPPLVDQIAELKMIRSLQVRVNSRTDRYSKMLEDPDDAAGQAIEEDLRVPISRLGEREERIQTITRDIVLGKNQ